MPLHDYKCRGCKQIHEGFQDFHNSGFHTCPYCLEIGDKILATGRSGRYHKFPEGWWRDIDIEGIYIKNRKQLKEECSKRDLSSVYLLDS